MAAEPAGPALRSQHRKEARPPRNPVLRRRTHRTPDHPRAPRTPSTIDVKTPSSVLRSALPTRSPLPPQPTCALSPQLATPHASRSRTATALSAAAPPRVRNRPRLGCPTGLPGGSRKGVPCVSRGPPSSKAQAQNEKPPAGGAAACCSPGEQQLENNRSEQQVTGSLPVLPRLSPCRARVS